MKVTKVYINKLENSKTLALASVTLYNEFVVTGLRLLNGKNGLWVSMPSRKDSNGEYHDIAYPVTKEAREDIQKAVIDKYNENEFASPQQEEVYNELHSDHPVIDVSSDDLPF